MKNKSLLKKNFQLLKVDQLINYIKYFYSQNKK